MQIESRGQLSASVFISYWIPAQPNIRTYSGSLVVYPLAGLLATHPYPETPLFGVVPCPTTIFTLGLLLIASHPRPVVLAAVPMGWAAIGGSAAVLLSVPQDWGLLVAGLIWLTAWIRER